MKKIMFFAIAALFGICMNASAALTFVSGEKTTIDNIQYTVTHFYKNPANANQRNTVSVKANNFTGAALAFEGTIELDIEVTGDDAGANAYKGKATFIVNEIEAEGFAGIASITSVSLPAEVEIIGANAFEGCENLATVTLAASSKLGVIGDGAFSWTSITSLDLSTATEYNATPATPANKTGLAAFGTGVAVLGPLTSAKHPTNAMIEEVKLPSTCETISAYALAKCPALTTIDLKTVKTIGGHAFLGDKALASVVIGTAPEKPFGTNPPGVEEGIAIGANAFSGCAALKTVELGKLIAASIDVNAFTAEAPTAVGYTPTIYATWAALIAAVPTAVEGSDYVVNSYVWNATTNVYDEVTTAKVDANAATPIETVKYNEIAEILTTLPFATLPTIKEVHFLKYIKVAGAVAAGSFQVNTTNALLTKIYYSASTVELPTATAYVDPFATGAFSTAATPRPAELYCLDKFYTDANGFGGNDVKLNGVTIIASANVVIGKDGKLIKDNNSSNYYYYYKPAGNMSIARSQESGATVTVYQAYIDIVTEEDKANIYMIPMKVSNGLYVVNGTQTVIIKSNQEDGVVAAPGGTSTMLSDGGGIVNNLQLTAAKVSALTVKTGTDYLNSGANDLYFLNNPATSGFGFTKYDATKQTGGLGANCVYMVCAHTAAARVEVIWLDNSDATAIIGAKKLVKNDGAIYNLAGQKVNASYKGVVIKDGKKYIQK